MLELSWMFSKPEASVYQTPTAVYFQVWHNSETSSTAPKTNVKHELETFLPRRSVPKDNGMRPYEH